MSKVDSSDLGETIFRKLLVLVLLLALFPRPAMAEQEDIELAKRAVVRVVVVEGPRGVILGYGNGFAISNRKIVTNWHVVEAIRDRRVFVIPFEGNDPVPVWVLKFDRARDLALSGGKQRNFLRRIQSSTPPLQTSDRFKAVQRSGTRTRVITQSATISPGNWDGPLIDECRRVVGVNTFISNSDLPGRVNYAVPTR